MDPATVNLIIQGISGATQLLLDYQQAAAAGDQAALDVIHARAVAQANLSAPPGAAVVQVQ